MNICLLFVCWVPDGRYSLLNKKKTFLHPQLEDERFILKVRWLKQSQRENFQSLSHLWMWALLPAWVFCSYSWSLN